MVEAVQADGDEPGGLVMLTPQAGASTSRKSKNWPGSGGSCCCAAVTRDLTNESG